MKLRKRTGHFLLALMLAVQVALAQHATVHFTEGAHDAPVHHRQGHQPDKDELCQLCLLSKGFAKILPPAGPDVAAPADAGLESVVLLRPPVMGGDPSPYIARAPPAFSA